MRKARGARSLPAATLVLLLAVAVGVALRLLWLDRLTGIDGDEAWYGALGQHWAAGDFTLWRTPSGNFPGPIQPILVAIGQFFAPSQFIVLRIPSLLSSLAAMALAWWIGKRHFDAATARLALLLMAVLPGNIAYARFGWDPSHSGLILLGGVMLALERQLVLTALLYSLAVWTHPTNVFAAPLLLPIFAAADRTARDKRWAMRAGLLGLTMAIATGAMMSIAIQAGQFANPGAIVGRLVSPGDWLAFLLLLGRLVAGQPWFVHLAGSGYGALLPLIDAVGLAALAGTLWFIFLTLKREGISPRGGVLIGWLAMVSAYALIGGIAPLNPPTERYAFVLLAPTALVLAMALGKVAGRHEALASGLIGTSLIAATIAFYLMPLATLDRGDRNLSAGVQGLRTGPAEPKEAAARWLIAEARRGGRVQVVADDWWLKWPLTYRLHGEPVSLVDRPTGRTFDAVFAGSVEDRRLEASGARVAWTSTGFDGRPVVRLWAVTL